MAQIRVTIEKGYQPIVQKAMARLGTDDYKVGVQHILGEWSATQVEQQPNSQNPQLNNASQVQSFRPEE
ncbi:hypothetical protein U2F10_05515 [Leptothoe sp. EHU-05/26/07-4]